MRFIFLKKRSRENIYDMVKVVGEEDKQRHRGWRSEG